MSLLSRKVTDPESRILRLADSILLGRVQLIEGCRSINSLLHRIPDIDQGLFDTFLYVDSETDHIPYGETYAKWGPEARDRFDRETLSIERDIRDFVISACRDVVLSLSGYRWVFRKSDAVSSDQEKVSLAIATDSGSSKNLQMILGSYGSLELLDYQKNELPSDFFEFTSSDLLPHLEVWSFLSTVPKDPFNVEAITSNLPPFVSESFLPFACTSKGELYLFGRSRTEVEGKVFLSTIREEFGEELDFWESLVSLADSLPQFLESLQPHYYSNDHRMA